LSNLLVISADLLLRTQISDLLRNNGYEVTAFADLPDALQSGATPDAVLLHPILPGTSAEDSLKIVRERWPASRLLILFGAGCVPSLIERCDDFVEISLPRELFLQRIEKSLLLADFLGREAGAPESPRTQLQTRNQFMSGIRWEIARKKRYQVESVVVRIAIDFFGKLRDSLGSRAAERSQRDLAYLVLKSTRPSDRVASFEDDGVAVLLTETSLDGSRGFVANMRSISASLSGTSWTISFGLAPVPDSADSTADSWVRLASDALRSAQRSGRGQARVARIDSGTIRFLELYPR